MTKILQSSSNPNKLSLTVSGIIIALVPVILYICARLGLTLTEIEIIELANSLAIIMSSVMIFFGLARKIYIKIKK